MTTQRQLTILAPGLLGASAARGKAPLTLSVRASLSPAASGRVVTLEAFTGRSWQTTSSAKTNAAGRTSWQFALDRGSYRISARFAGDATYRGSVSRAVSVTVS